MSACAVARQPDDSELKHRPPARPVTRQAVTPFARRSRRSSRVVLIVDDSKDAREMYALHLKHRGFTTYMSPDGGAAIEMALTHRPDVVVMDLAMPDVDGITAIRRLKMHPRTRLIPVILLTGYPSKAIERGAIEAGAHAFLTKPCLPEDLEAHVRRLLPEAPGSAS